jgi:hypothetical protein
MIRYWVAIVFVLIALSAEISWIDKLSAQNIDTPIENKILDLLFSLPEVKMSDRFVDSLTNHRHGISMRIVHRPNRLEKYYTIDAGYNSSERFENYYNFYVWPDKMIIKIVDSYTGRLLTLAEWRKKRKPGAVIR